MRTSYNTPKRTAAPLAMSAAMAMMFARAEMTEPQRQVGPPAPAYGKRANQAKRRRVARRLRGGR
jgi:hypothetical protein